MNIFVSLRHKESKLCVTRAHWDRKKVCENSTYPIFTQWGQIVNWWIRSSDHGRLETDSNKWMVRLLLWFQVTASGPLHSSPGHRDSMPATSSVSRPIIISGGCLLRVYVWRWEECSELLYAYTWNTVRPSLIRHFSFFWWIVKGNRQ